MKKKTNKKPTFALWEVFLITIISSLVMAGSTGYMVYKNEHKDYDLNNSNEKYTSQLISTYNSILDNYYENINQDQLVDSAIKGMMDYLGDPYTSYLDKNSSDLLNDSLTGTYEGIGIQVRTNDDMTIEVMKVFDDSPAKKSGIQIGDIIISVNDESVKDSPADVVVDKIKASKNAKVKVGVSRENKEIEFEVERKVLNVPSVTASTYERNNKVVGYIYISTFSATTYTQFLNELTKLENGNINSLIIDVRDNTGGYLNVATQIAELFLEKNKVIYSLENKNSKDVTKDTTDENRKYKIDLLINNGSASASEILAAALKYSYGSKLIGEKSYGKGKVQQTSSLTDGTMLKYTTAKWLTPNGDCIDGIGLIPDIESSLTEEYAKNPIDENDLQLQTAIEDLTK